MMKKLTAILCAVMLCGAMTACGDDSVANQTESSVAAGESSSVETSDASSAAADESSVAADDSAAENSDAAQDSAAEKKDSSELKMVNIAKKINEWKDGNVRMNMDAEEDGVQVKMQIDNYGGDTYCSMEMPGIFSYSFYFDSKSKKQYTILDSEKVYSCTETDTPDESMTVINESDISAELFKESGTKEIDGKQYTYEEYQIDTSDAPVGMTLNSSMRFFFDEKDNVRFMQEVANGVESSAMPFEIIFMDTVDTSKFKLPEGYTEISAQDVANKMLQGMMGSLGELATTTEATN